jgi:hypothetical protein
MRKKKEIIDEAFGMSTEFKLGCLLEVLIDIRDLMKNETKK